MKKIDEKSLRESLRAAIIRANFHLRGDLQDYFVDFTSRVTNEQAESVRVYLENSRLAREEKRGLCQDTGYVQIYLTLGNQVVFDFDFQSVCDEVVAEVYDEFSLRKSLAKSVSRENTKKNTPAFINVELTNGNEFSVQLLLKGGGSENVTRAAMLLPTLSQNELIDWFVESVSLAGAKACPPYILGIGIGGTLEKAVGMSKKMLLQTMQNAEMNETEAEIAATVMEKSNRLSIGFQGLKFGETVIGAVAREMPCHIATLPVALSIGCNSVRQAEFSL